jgi:hypothetical protein
VLHQDEGYRASRFTSYSKPKRWAALDIMVTDAFGRASFLGIRRPELRLREASKYAGYI